MPTFSMMVWYNSDEYGKAWTEIEAASEEEARAKFMKAFDDGKEYEFDWEFHAKGGGGEEFDLEDIQCFERQEPDNG